MAYAEAMSATPPAVTDHQLAALHEHLSDAELVELTAIIAVENCAPGSTPDALVGENTGERAAPRE